MTLLRRKRDQLAVVGGGLIFNNQIVTEEEIKSWRDKLEYYHGTIIVPTVQHIDLSFLKRCDILK